MYGLTEEQWNKIKSIMAANPRISRVVLYGSRAIGTYKPFSDVDITLVGDDLTHSDLNRIILAIDDLLLPYQFDISLFHTLKNAELIGHINRRGVVIYDRETSPIIKDNEREQR